MVINLSHCLTRESKVLKNIMNNYVLFMQFWMFYGPLRNTGESFKS